MVVMHNALVKYPSFFACVNVHFNSFQLGIYYVRSKVRLMKHTRSSKMDGSAMEIRFLQLSLQR